MDHSYYSNPEAVAAPCASRRKKGRQEGKLSFHIRNIIMNGRRWKPVMFKWCQNSSCQLLHLQSVFICSQYVEEMILANLDGTCSTIVITSSSIYCVTVYCEWISKIGLWLCGPVVWGVSPGAVGSGLNGACRSPQLLLPGALLLQFLEGLPKTLSGLHPLQLE